MSIELSCKLSKYAHIFEDLKAEDIMTKQVSTLTADKKISQAKEMMKIKKISGIPIVNDENKLIGIISIEDIIKALETGEMEEKIEKIMTKEVISLKKEDNLPSIIQKFEMYKFGRFPVVDEKNFLCGILTKVDILHKILDKFNLIYLHDKKRNSILNQDLSLITGEKLDIKKAEFKHQIDTTDISRAGEGAAILKSFLINKGIDSEIARKVGIAVYEAETNVVIHSKGEGEILCFIKKDKIIVRVIDNGIGIENLDQAMKEGFSTAPDYIRELGFGAGMGIPNMKRFADKLVILSEKNSGTQVEFVFFLKDK